MRSVVRVMDSRPDLTGVRDGESGILHREIDYRVNERLILRGKGTRGPPNPNER